MNSKVIVHGLYVTTAIIASVCSQAHAESSSQAWTESDFYVGGEYRSGANGDHFIDGAMYVEKLVPDKVQHPLPLVFFHGAGQTAMDWLATPDGRDGWAQYFVKLGYVVYLTDQPARGRSPYIPALDGDLAMMSAERAESQFTDTEQLGQWPQAAKHTQWPGEGDTRGKIGNPIFDRFYRTQVPYLADRAKSEQLTQQAGAMLLDKIGPAFLVVHSQAGTFGWLLADARPALVRGIVAVEPEGPPFRNAVFTQSPARAWGLTDIPITYSPQVSDPAALEPTEQPTSDGPGLVRCVLQGEPAHRLINLVEIPVALLVGEASYHAGYDHCTARYLQQAGVSVELIRLVDRGIYGNGHLSMLEKNSDDVAGVIADWLSPRDIGEQ